MRSQRIQAIALSDSQIVSLIVFNAWKPYETCEIFHDFKIPPFLRYICFRYRRKGCPDGLPAFF